MTLGQFLHGSTRTGWTCRLVLYIAVLIVAVIAVQLLTVVG